MNATQSKDTKKKSFSGFTDEELNDTANYNFGSDEKDQNANPDIEWEQPLPLNNQLLPVLPLTPDMLPEALRAWLLDTAYRMKCPLDFVASAAVVMLSSLIGTRLAIKPKTREDWGIVPNLWGAVIGGPSAMKTPSVNEVLRPLNRLIIAARVAFEDDIADYERECADYEAQKKAYNAQAADKHKGKTIEHPVAYPEAPKKPIERRYLISDATVEKIADLLNENPTGMLQYRDEMTGQLAGWDRAGHEQDRAFFLEAWNGSGSMTIDRIGRGTTHVKNLCLSLFGGIQPAKLLPYLQAATGYENDGFVQRLQVAVYPDPAPWEYVDEYPDKAARDRAFTLIKTVADADFSNIGYDADDYDVYPYTRFEASAQEIFKQWLIEWETKVLPNETGLLLEHFTKYRSLIPSLALVFHVVDCLDAPQPVGGSAKRLVGEPALLMAIRWSDYLMSHARRVYGLLDTAGIHAAKELLRHIKAGHLRDGFKNRDVVKKGWTALVAPAEVDAALAELLDRHYIQEVEPPTPTNGRPRAPHYLINPTIIQKA